MADIRIPDGKLDYQRQPWLGEGPGGEAMLIGKIEMYS